MNDKPSLKDNVLVDVDTAFIRAKDTTNSLVEQLESSGAELIARAKIMRSQWDSFEREYHRMQQNNANKPETK